MRNAPFFSLEEDGALRISGKRCPPRRILFKLHIQYGTGKESFVENVFKREA